MEKVIGSLRNDKDFIPALISGRIQDLGTRRVATEDAVTPHHVAIGEIKRRRLDSELRKRVEDYLENDIPEYFQGEPVLYLCRHLASPNIQTLRFLHVVREEGMKTVIGQDTKDIFASLNQLKKPLAKLRICTGIFHEGDRVTEQFQNVSIVDINQANGKPLEAIQTKWGEPLVEFHNNLFKELTNDPVHIEEDSAWVDRYSRGDLLAEYKKFLALFLVHGIMFEDYPMEDSEEEALFVTDILRPAMRHVMDRFGIRPLIAPLVPMGIGSTALWEGYPPEVLEVVEANLQKHL